MRHTTTLFAAVLLLAVSGCSSDGEGSKPTVTKASPTPTVASPKPSPSPSKEETLKLGDTANISAESDFTATALDYTDKGVRGVPELLGPDQKWSVVMVKVCNKGDDPIATTPLVWSLAYADGVRVEAAGMNAGELPQPLYPMEAKVSSGDCVKGNIAFTVPESGRPERVLYSPDALDEPVEWKIGK